MVGRLKVGVFAQYRPGGGEDRYVGVAGDYVFGAVEHSHRHLRRSPAVGDDLVFGKVYSDGVGRAEDVYGYLFKRPQLAGGAFFHRDDIVCAAAL